MSNRTLTIDDRVYDYILSVSVDEPELLRRLREETAKDPMARMQIAPEQGQFMSFLVELMEVRRAIEVGTFTGYSSLRTAMAMADDDCELICCDSSEKWTAVARRYWREAGLQRRIELRLGPALDTLDALLAAGRAGEFDFAFIDADKENYQNYFERCLQLLRPGGVVTIDNTLWSGSVADPNDEGTDTVAIREFNKQLHADQRISLTLVPIGDGLTLARKR